MKNKVLLSFAILFSCTLSSHAEKVNPEKAEKVAHAYAHTIPQLKSKNNMQLSRTVFKELKPGNTLRAAQEEPMYYVFSMADDKGFIIVSADDRAVPVLGYSESGNYDTNNPNLSYWLDCLAQEIASGIENNIPQSAEIKAKWETCLNDNAPALRASNAATAVPPLLQTQWDQGTPYNALCPGGSATGCVATAMAQIMKYWNYPATGASSWSYTPVTHPEYGLQFADFGNTTYDWANMTNTYSPSSSTAQKDAVATLMYHCGVSVNMDYAPGGSNANVLAAVSALVKYFKYDASITHQVRNNFTDAEWVNILKAELDGNRPVYYSGQSTGGGHVFVCDGYDSNNLFHFNWGWSGNSDGYFQLSALNPSVLGIDGSAGGYNTDQAIITGIRPYTGGTPDVHLGLSDLYASRTSLTDVTETFSVGAVKITNTGPDINTFIYFGLLLCQGDGTPIDYRKIYYYDMSGFASGYYFASDMIFSYYSLPAGLAPGTYKLYGAFSTELDAETPIKMQGANGDRYISITVLPDNTVTLTTKSDIAPVLSLVSLAPAGNLYQNKSGSFTATIANNGTGDYNSLLTLQLNGTEIITDPVVIPFGTTKTISFSPAIINLPPGSYPLTLWQDPNNNQSTPSVQLGSPVSVNVLATPASASSGIPMVVAGKVHISGQVYSAGAVIVYAKTAWTADTGRVEIDNTNGALLYADSIILCSNDTSDGLVRNLNTTTANGAVQGTSTVIVRKTFAPGRYTYFSLPFATKTLYQGGTKQSLGAGGKNFAAWIFNAQVRSGYLGFFDPSRVWTEINYATGFARGTGYQFYSVLGGDVDFVTTAAGDIRNMFTPSDKSVTYTMYRTTNGINIYQEPVDAGWAFIGGVNAADFSLRQANVGGYPGGTVYYRNTTNSQSTNDQRYGAYNEFVLGDDDASKTVNVGPYTPFYIQGAMSAAGAANGTFTFNCSGLVLDNVTFRSSGEEEGSVKDKLYFALTSDKDNSYDRFYLNFADNDAESYVAIEDALKMSTGFSDRPAVWSIQDATNQGLVVNGLPMKDDREVRMGFSVPQAGDYTLSLNPMRQEDVRNVILIDNVTGKKVDLLQTPYSFHSESVTAETGRFLLFINSSSTGTPAIEAPGIYAYVKNNILTVKNLTEGDRIQVLDLSGRIMASGKAAGKEFSVSLRGKGVYLVQVSGEKSSVIKVLNK